VSHKEDSKYYDRENDINTKLKEIAQNDGIEPSDLLGKFLLLQAVLGRIDKTKAEKALDDFLSCLDEEIIEAYEKMKEELEIDRAIEEFTEAGNFKKALDDLLERED
jgi:hypothetical protein